MIEIKTIIIEIIKLIIKTITEIIKTIKEYNIKNEIQIILIKEILKNPILITATTLILIIILIKILKTKK